MSRSGGATRRQWVGLAVLSLPTMLVSMDLTVLYLAVPALSADLSPSSTELLWIVDIYGFMVAGLLITMGTLGDRIGRRRLLLGGAAAFGCASLLAAFSTSAAMLIAARAVLGMAGATLMPSTLSLIRNMFPIDSERSVAIGVWASSFSIGAVIGPLCGGLMLEHFWWGSVFLLNVPVMLLLLGLGRWLLPEFRDPRPGRFDFASVALSIVAMLSLIWGVKHLAGEGGSLSVLLALGLGVALGLAFIRRQQRLADPLIDLALFRNPAFSVSVATNMLAVLVCLGVFLLIAQYLQLVLGLSPLAAGLWTTPTALANILGSMTAPRLVRLVRPGQVVGAGLALGAAGLLLLARGDGLVVLVTATAVMFLGVSAVMTICTDLIVASAPPERAGVASAISETGGELGGALGIALLGSVALLVYRLALAGHLPAELHGMSFAETLAMADTLPESQGIELRDAARAAFVLSMRFTAAAGAGLALCAALAVPILLRRLPRQALAPAAAADG